MVMNNQYLQNPSVRLERLSPVVIEALRGHVVQNIEMLQSLPTLNMTMLSMLLRRKVLNQLQTPQLEVVLERLPEQFYPPRVVTKKKRPLKLLAQSTETKPNQPNINTNNVKALQVTLERLPKNIVNIITPENVCKVKKQKRKVSRPKKHMRKG